MIKQVETEIVYDEAIDVEGAPYTYIETEEKIIEVINKIKGFFVIKCELD